jgi:hypothetical protein
MNNSILAIVAVLAAVAMLSVAVGVVPLQEAEARKYKGGDCSGDGSFCFSQNQVNKCREAGCSNSATTTITVS